MSRLPPALALLTLLPLSTGDGVVVLPLRTATEMARTPASLIAAKTGPLPDGNVEFCAGPGHQ